MRARSGVALQGVAVPSLKSMMRIKLSILDLAPIGRGQTATESFAASVALAQLAEEQGYERVWYAEHHNSPGWRRRRRAS